MLMDAEHRRTTLPSAFRGRNTLAAPKCMDIVHSEIKGFG